MGTLGAFHIKQRKNNTDWCDKTVKTKSKINWTVKTKSKINCT